MPAAVAIPAAISGATSLVSGILGSRAANKAGQMQSEEATRQAQGLRDILAQYNPQIGTAADRGGQLAINAAGQIRSDATAANELLTPYTTLGAEGAQNLRDFMAPGGAGTKTFTAADMVNYDPGYQFRLDEAQKALEKSAAAKGGLLGGGTSKALAKYQQNLASSEFGAAAERFRQQQTDRYNRLFGITDLGGRYATQSGQNLLTAGQAGLQAGEYAGNLGFQGANAMAENAFNTQRSIADLMTGGASARAAGTVGSANAWGSALGGVAGAAGQVGRYFQDQTTLDKIFGSGGVTRSTIPAGGGIDWRNPALDPTYPYAMSMGNV